MIIYAFPIVDRVSQWIQITITCLSNLEYPLKKLNSCGFLPNFMAGLTAGVVSYSAINMEPWAVKNQVRISLE